MYNKTRKIVISSLMAAICFIVTRFVMIPALYTEGYVNMGDSIVLLCALIPGGIYGFLAAGIGAALADLAAGYVVYIPATFLIKAVMALIVHLFISKKMRENKAIIPAISAGCICAEIFMVAGYFLYELFLYGPAAIASVVGNSIQAGANAVIGIIFICAISKNKNLKKFIDNIM